MNQMLHVRWVDSYADLATRWTGRDELAEMLNDNPTADAYTCETVGFVIEDGAVWLTLARSVCEQEVEGVFRIPQAAVLARRPLLPAL